MIAAKQGPSVCGMAVSGSEATGRLEQRIQLVDCLQQLILERLLYVIAESLVNGRVVNINEMGNLSRGT